MFVRFCSFTGFLLLLLLANSCTGGLSVRTDYFTQENLASFYVETPDPNLYRPFTNQRLIISWYLSTEKIKRENLELRAVVRLKNLHEEKIVEPIHKRTGFYIFQLNQEQLRCSGGILTYKVEIWSGDCLLEVWQHPLWVELIQFNLPKHEQPTIDREGIYTPSS